MATKNNSAQRDQWFKFSIYAAIIWLIGLVLIIVASPIGAASHAAGSAVYAIGAILFFIAWIIVLIFGIFTIIVSIPKTGNDQILGIICGVLCIVFPLVGVIMAWILYYKK